MSGIQSHNEIILRLSGKKCRLLKDKVTPQLRTVIENIDSLLGSNVYYRLIKDDTKISVGVIKGRQMGLPYDILIKHFHYRNMIQYHVKKLWKNNVVHAFLTHQSILRHGLNVPELIGLCIGNSPARFFLLSKYINNADNLANLFLKGEFFRYEGVADELGDVLARWHLAGAVHGDLKWSNILMQRNDSNFSFYFVDIDQTKIYPHPNMKGIIKDLIRFYRYGLELGSADWIDSVFFPAYLSRMPNSLKPKINYDVISREASLVWQNKGCRRLRII